MDVLAGERKRITSRLQPSEGSEDPQIQTCFDSQIGIFESCQYLTDS